MTQSDKSRYHYLITGLQGDTNAQSSLKHRGSSRWAIVGYNNDVMLVMCSFQYCISGATCRVHSLCVVEIFLYKSSSLWLLPLAVLCVQVCPVSSSRWTQWASRAQGCPPSSGLRVLRNQWVQTCQLVWVFYAFSWFSVGLSSRVAIKRVSIACIYYYFVEAIAVL